MEVGSRQSICYPSSPSHGLLMVIMLFAKKTLLPSLSQPFGLLRLVVYYLDFIQVSPFRLFPIRIWGQSSGESSRMFALHVA